MHFVFCFFFKELSLFSTNKQVFSNFYWKRKTEKKKYIVFHYQTQL